MIKDFNKENDWALILGGSSGLGLASAKKLARHGMNIFIVHRNSRADMQGIHESFEEIRQNDIQLKTFNIDATNQTKIDSVVSTIQKEIGDGKICCLLHSIARGSLKAMVGEEEELELNDLTITLHAMATSLYQWVKTLHKNQLFANDTRILSFTSEGNEKAMKHYAAVSVAKAALEALTRSIALEFAPYGIRANCIQAGVTYTPSQDMIPGSEEMRKFASVKNPFNKITTSKDVANVVYLLCKKEAAWINGTIIPVDGGESIC